MTSGKTDIENLVFEGGGVRGIAYAGALKLLEERGMMEGVRRVAGSSAGAFVALLLSLGYSSDGLKDALKAMQFKTLEDKPNPIRVATHYGLYKGEVLYDWIARQVTDLGLPESLTFADLATEGKRELKVFATDLTIRNTREFSAEQTPDASVVGAVRASMSIPLMYAAWQFPDGKPNNHLYVDGGTVYNYPISAFDGERDITDSTLGFCFTRGADSAPAHLELDNLFEFTKSLFATLLSAQAIDFDRDPEQVRRSVLIDDLGFKATDLDLSATNFDRLYTSGYQATQRYFDDDPGMRTTL
ncbi:patatin-like phospholipase family protein [Kordiimonas lacus]|uniref:NTE family protein n=1 Tax=Kordiimonas lacus TaxID=637679 RepID=A0A1G6TZ88_9PROT|nr:patatin-like phospholipase family protein [Kordiimonas lacus]SDD34244.1 NTE family protein [Kordiimonas lacus]